MFAQTHSSRPAGPHRAARLGLVLGTTLVLLCGPIVAGAQTAPAKAAPRPAVVTPSAPAPALVPDNPYAAVVPVDDDSDKSRDKGLRLALIEVLKRVVGRADQATSPILARADSLVQQYAFLRDPASGAYSLKAVFDIHGVNEALRGQGLPVFGVDSDLVEAWTTEVHGVRSAADYARVLDLFAGLRGVRHVEVDGLSDAGLRLRMVVEGGIDRLVPLVMASGALRSDGPGSYVLAR